MKKDNIFQYATKELTQDAFLRWLLENHDSDYEDVRYMSKHLIGSIIGQPSNQSLNIENVETRSQEHKIDILALLKINQENYLLAIEDKTDSHEHDGQLDRYRNYLENKYSDYKKYYVFYKTTPIIAEEISSIMSKGWLVFDINDINELFNDSNIIIKHYLLKSYIEHIKSLHRTFVGDLPTDIREWDIKYWQNYSFKMNIKLPDNIECKIGNYRNQYIMFAYNYKNQWENLPYVEFTSRDVSNHKFNMKILTYRINEELVKEKRKIWQNKISVSKQYKQQNYKKQIGKSRNSEDIKTSDDLEKVLIKYIDEFSKVVLMTK